MTLNTECTTRHQPAFLESSPRFSGSLFRDLGKNEDKWYSRMSHSGPQNPLPSAVFRYRPSTCKPVPQSLSLKWMPPGTRVRRTNGSGSGFGKQNLHQLWWLGLAATPGSGELQIALGLKFSPSQRPCDHRSISSSSGNRARAQLLLGTGYGVWTLI